VRKGLDGPATSREQSGCCERNARKLKGDKRRTGALATRAAALTTYAPFPLEEEKQKLLSP